MIGSPSRGPGTNLAINGRALRAGGGVGRYAEQVTARMTDAKVVMPPSRCSGPGVGQLWEQTSLTRAAAHQSLLSLANSGPIRHDDHVLVVHDLLALTHPATVSPAFALLQQRLLPASIRGARSVVTVSNAIRDEIIDHIGIDPACVHVAPPGVKRGAPPSGRILAKQRIGVAADQPLIAGIVSSAPRKNSAGLLRALEAVGSARPEVAIRVAGCDGPSHVFGRGASRPRSTAVVDLGAIDDEAMTNLLAAADIFVGLSEAEGFGMPVAEAAACGAAVVSTPIPSVTEHVNRHHDAALIVANTDEAADAVIALVDAEPTRTARGALGAEAVAELTWDRTVEQLNRVIAHENEMKELTWNRT